MVGATGGISPGHEEVTAFRFRSSPDGRALSTSGDGMTPDKAEGVGTAFLYQLMTAMRKTVPDGNGSVSSGMGGGVFQRQFDWEVAGALSRKVGFDRFILGHLKPSGGEERSTVGAG